MTEFPVKATLDPKGIDMLIAGMNKAGKATDATDKEIKELNDDIRRTGTQGTTSMNNINKGMENLVNTGIKKVGTALLAAFAIDKLLSFGKEVVNITAEFQKMEAVLTTALGSKSAAQIAMRELEQFAARTPFSVKELTASYVKLVNQGFKPTVEELTKLGDLSASTGKQFDQLTEAIIDAQTGEFERLKEFGIRASKEGEKVTFTFKGVKTQVDFTSEAIRNYITNLGEAAGVTGSMAAISETLGGGISNLGDAWDHFMETIGDGEKGPLQNAVKNLSYLLALATDFIKTDAQRRDDADVEAAARAVDNLKSLANAYGDVSKASADYLKLLEFQLHLENKYNNTLSRVDENLREEVKSSNAKVSAIKAQIQAVKDYTAAEEGRIKTSNDAKQSEIDAKNALQAAEDAKFMTYVRAYKALQDRVRAEKKASDEMLQNDTNTFTQRFNQLKLHNNFVIHENDAFNKLIKKQNDEAAKEMKESKDQTDADLLEKELLHQQRIMDAKMAAIDFAIGLADALFENQQYYNNLELDALRSQREYELEITGTNAEAKKQINKKYDEEQRQLKIKQAQRDRDQALYNIFVNGLQGVMAALASVPPNVPLSISIGALALINEGLVATRPLPKFARGKFQFQGKGSETSDSNLVQISHNESVAPANTGRRFPSLLKPMIENPNLTWKDISAIVDQNLPVELRRGIRNARPTAEGGSQLMLEEMRGMRKDIRSKKELHLDIDETGFRKWVREGDSWTEYVDKRYRF